MDVPVLQAERLMLRPLTDDDLDELARIVASAGVREWWGAIDDPDRLREELRGDDAGFAVDVEGALAGWLSVAEEDDPDWRHAALDIVLDSPHQDRGLGSEALRTVIGWLIEARGHHRFTIDPNVQNERAIRAYAAVGFRPVGVLRRYGRMADGRWHDHLLMDLLADELLPRGGGRPPAIE